MTAARAFALFRFVVFAALLAWISPWARAQTPPPPASPRSAAATENAPVALEADRIVFDVSTNRLVATGRVRARSNAFALWADEVIYEAEREEVVATGNVILEEEGRRLAAAAVRYDLRRRLVTATDQRGVQEQIYLRAQTVEATRDVIRAMDALITLCDPDSPLYRVVARRATVTPDGFLVTEDASFYLGEVRLFTLPHWRFPIRAPEEGLLRPSAGVGSNSGPWVAVTYRYPVGTFRGQATIRYNANLGFEFTHQLTYPQPGWALSLNAGTFRDSENREYDALELEAITDATRLQGTVLSHRLTLRAGDYRDRTTNSRGLKVEAVAALWSESFQLSDLLSASFQASLRVARYEDRTFAVPILQPTLHYRVDDRSYITLSHSYIDNFGSTPFVFDSKARESITTFSYTWTDRPFRYRLGVQYDFVPRNVKLVAGVWADYGNWTASVYGTFNTTRSRFEDLDFAATLRCDCASVSFTYRMVRGEIWLNFVPFPSPRLPAHVPQPPSPPLDPPSPAP
ncbi:MAG: LPS-assembly protein LptD [Armatimonadetes bacterium]|nr:LPS-assembly protein LptD [Armatimonadota bacterium]